MSKYIGDCQHSPLALQNGCGNHGSHHGSHGRHPNSQWGLGRLRSADIAAVVQETSSDLILKRILFELAKIQVIAAMGTMVPMGTKIVKRCL